MSSLNARNDKAREVSKRELRFGEIGEVIGDNAEGLTK